MAATSARETAYQIIKDKIIGLELTPGQAINDKELAEELNMSRTPVHEAVIMLNVAGVIIVRPQSGTFVAPINMETVQREQFFRCALEKEMVKAACRKAAPEHQTLYDENIHLHEFYINSKIPRKEQKLLQLDNDYHRIAFTISGNADYFDYMHSMMLHIERVRSLSLHAIADPIIINDHRQIAESILAGDYTRAETKIEEHMHRYNEDVMQLKEKLPEYFFIE